MSTQNAFTVAVSGSGRHDGEKPYWYVVTAADIEEAGAKALRLHAEENDDDDLIIVPAETHPGVPDCPPDTIGYAWNDRRNGS